MRSAREIAISAMKAEEAEVRSAREIAISAMKARGERAREREEIARVARQLATMDAQVSLVNCLLMASDCQLATMDAQVSAAS